MRKGGAYVFNVYVGAHYFHLTSEANFGFNVMSMAAPLRKAETSCRLIENGFGR